MASPIDARAFKQQQRDDWDRAAPRWRDYDQHLRRNYEATTRRLLEMAGIQPSHRVLDIASGTGEPGLPAAQIVGPSGFVLLTDQSLEMLAVAREKARAQVLTMSTSGSLTPSSFNSIRRASTRRSAAGRYA